MNTHEFAQMTARMNTHEFAPPSHSPSPIHATSHHRRFRSKSIGHEGFPVFIKTIYKVFPPGHNCVDTHSFLTALAANTNGLADAIEKRLRGLPEGDQKEAFKNIHKALWKEATTQFTSGM